MSLKQLQLASALNLPSREAMLNRDPSVQHFWRANRAVVRDAWHEWESNEQESLFKPDSALIDKRLREAVMQAWEDPSKESAVKALWTEVATDVFECQFFDPERLADLRSYLEKIWDAQIPLRPPYGILLNRGGAMLDSRSEGYLAAPTFQAFYNELLSTYMRPVARLLFPEVTGYDTQTFGFSIHYKPSTEDSIRAHTDASAVTLNVNLNMPNEEFTGSSVDFLDSQTGQVNSLTFKPGTALIHRGSVVHAAQPITSGERTNFVLWLFGRHGQLPPQGGQRHEIDATERWVKTTESPDGYAPF